MLLNRQAPMLGIAAIAALASAQDEVAAATATLEVSATVANACTVESGSLDFGAYHAGPQAPSLEGSGGFNVQCTSPASVDIKLDGGLNEGAGGDARAMKGPGNSYLNYALFEGASPFAFPWDPGLEIAYPVNSGANEVVVNGVIAAGQTAQAGEYSDTVQITMTFN
jgi:spore coat protein U-like protein